MGKEKIDYVFATLQEEGGKAFVPYIMGDLQMKENILFLQENGAHLLEIGVPFSNPVADGPTIQVAGMKALAQGITVEKLLGTLVGMKDEIRIPIVLMTYINPIIAYGIERFMDKCREAGVDGLIIPDLPYEEIRLVTPYLENIALIPLVTLTSGEERITEITKAGSGFVYAVTVRGITGQREGFDDELYAFLKMVKEVSPLPVLAGFGIATAEHVAAIIPLCDGVVVGSKVIQLLEQGKLDELKVLVGSVVGSKVL